ncbi:MAG: heparinase II/III family protein [Planctomycetota bacterium]|nr:heparinase II/III family protein [Planctomycetota bacterium]
MTAAPPDISRDHPRLLGPLEDLKRLAKERPEAYARTREAARMTGFGTEPDNHVLFGKIPSMALVAAIDGDAKLAREAVDLVFERFINRPVRTGHVPFGSDVAFCALIYDFCHAAWTPAERERYFAYVTETREKNMGEEPSPFHNGWYGYKMWGFGLACLATWHENPAAEAMFAVIDEEYRRRAAPALEFSGAGGGFGEGYYIHYWLFEWLFFCECARACAGLDYYALAPKFFSQRAVASMFEMYPTIVERGTRRPVPMGDGGGRECHPERDKALTARRILVNYHRGDPAHQAVHAFNLQTPRVGFPQFAYRDFLWHDPAVKAGDLDGFKRAHVSPAAGYAYMRDSWQEDAAHLFFHCGPRFTAHQHLDNGHFTVFKHTELLGDGGHYAGWADPHECNYYVRTIAHNAVLIHDPSETWPNIRLYKDIANDGGQRFPGFKVHHNGAAMDVEVWEKNREEFDMGALAAFEDGGDVAYAAGDSTKAYASQKVSCVTRQIVLLRPGTFVIFDRVVSTNPAFKKTVLFQPMQAPEGGGAHWTVTNGKGKLFIETVLPRDPRVAVLAGAEQYSYGGRIFPPQGTIFPAPAARMEISPAKPAKADYFLHVLTATDAAVASVPQAALAEDENSVSVTIGDATLRFLKHELGASLERGGRRRDLARSVPEP